MKSERRWALIAAFILFSMYSLSQHAYITSIPDNAEKMRHVYFLVMMGNLIGALLLPFLLPLNDFKENRCPAGSCAASAGSCAASARYRLRLVLMALFFLPNIIIRLLGEETYLSNPVNSGFMALGNGIVITLMHGLFFSMTGKNRLFWTAFAFSAGSFTYSFIMGRGQQVLQPFIFQGSGLILTIAGFLLFVYLYSNRFGVLTENKEIPEPENIRTDESKLKSIPFFLFPLIAAFIIFMSNSFTNQLFFLVLNSPLPPGFNVSNIILILALPLLGFLAALSWRRFLMIFIPVCSVILLLAPSLLLFAHSQPLFLILYTLNAIAARMITAVFPFIMMDMYLLYINQRKINTPVFIIGLGCLGWLLPVSIQMISISAFIPRNLFILISHDKASAVTLLTIAAIVFYILMWFVNKNLTFNGAANSSVKNTDILFKEHKFTNSEIKVARLLLEEGITNEEIAGRIFRSEATVKSHLTNIFRKFDVQSRTEFMAKVLKSMNG